MTGYHLIPLRTTQGGRTINKPSATLNQITVMLFAVLNIMVQKLFAYYSSVFFVTAVLEYLCKDEL